MITVYPPPTVIGTLTSDQPAAMAGIDGQPGSANRFITESSLIVSAENKDIVPILKGQPLKTHPSGIGVRLASSADTCVALAGGDAIVGGAVPIRAAGVISLPDWTLITGSSLLDPLGVYFLNTVPGHLTTAIPSTGFTQQVARALSLNILKIAIENPILL